MNMDRWFSISSIIIGFLFNRNEDYIFMMTYKKSREWSLTHSQFSIVFHHFYSSNRETTRRVTTGCLQHIVSWKLSIQKYVILPTIIAHYRFFFSHYSEVWVPLVLKRLKSIILLGDRDRGRSCVIWSCECKIGETHVYYYFT